MASVRKRDPKDPKSPWIVEYTIPETGKRKRATPKSGLKKDADQLRQKIEREINEGSHVARRDTVTVAEAFDLYVKDCEKRADYKDITRGSFLIYRACANRVSRVLGHLKLTDLTQEAAQRGLDQLAKEFSPRTVQHSVASLMRMLDYAVVSKLLKVSQVRPGRLLYPRAQRAARVPSRVQIEHLLSVSRARKPHEQERTRIMRHAMFCLAIFSTLRRGEICGLRWDDIDLDKSVIRVKRSHSQADGMKATKTLAGVRAAPLPPIVREALADIPGPREGHIFTRRDGSLPNPGNFGLYWYYLASKAGMADPPEPGKRWGKPHFRFHDMRHAAASLMIAQGANPLHIQRAMGHASVETTLGIYGHLFDEDDTISRATDAISAAFSAPKLRHGPQAVPQVPVPQRLLASPS